MEPLKHMTNVIKKSWFILEKANSLYIHTMRSCFCNQVPFFFFQWKIWTLISSFNLLLFKLIHIDFFSLIPTRVLTHFQFINTFLNKLFKQNVVVGLYLLLFPFCPLTGLYWLHSPMNSDKLSGLDRKSSLYLIKFLSDS